MKFIVSNQKDTAKAKNQLELALNAEGEVTVSVVNQDSLQTSDLASVDSATVEKLTVILDRLPVTVQEWRKVIMQWR